MSKNQEYAERYANFAMVQMRKYGIPAGYFSVEKTSGRTRRKFGT